MARLTPALLARCLADIQSGRLTFEQCLSEHPAVAGELRPLLEIALSLGSPPPVAPDAAFRARGRASLRAAIAADARQAPCSPLRRFWRALSTGWVPPSAGRMAVPALGAQRKHARTQISGGAIYAAQQALPGDGLYPLKTAVEQVQLAATASDAAKARAHLDLAGKRLTEIDQAHGRWPAVAAAAEAFVAHLDQADAHLIQALATGEDIGPLADSLADSLARHQTALDRARQRAAAPAQDALARAAQAARKGLVIAEAPAETTTERGATGTPNALAEEEHRRTAAGVAGSTSITLTAAISDVARLASSSSHAGNSYNGLSAKLKAAQAALARGQDDVAVRVLNAFASELNAMYRSGQIGPDEYDALFDRYQTTVSGLARQPKSGVLPGENGVRPANGSQRHADEEAPPAGAGPRNGLKEQLPRPWPPAR